MLRPVSHLRRRERLRTIEVDRGQIQHGQGRDSPIDRHRGVQELRDDLRKIHSADHPIRNVRLPALESGFAVKGGEESRSIQDKTTHALLPLSVP